MLSFVKRHLIGICMSLSMFCAIPMPLRIWDEKCLNLVIVYFPIVGTVIGLLWLLAAKLLMMIDVHVMLIAVLTAIVPFFTTGFIHLDGYMDTGDAILSRRPIEDKLRILKDPHTGAFAVIMLAVLFMLQFAAAYTAIEKNTHMEMLILICVISRCCAAIATVFIKPIAQSGYAVMFKKNIGVGHKSFIVFITAVAVVVSYIFAGNSGIIVSVVTILGSVAALAFACGDLKGISGDLAGFAVVISELAGLWTLAIL